jgi:O-antigen/teichoic acid export membrane protein
VLAIARIANWVVIKLQFICLDAWVKWQTGISNTKNGTPKRMRNYFLGPARKIFQGMATLALGSVLARLVGFASLPILTRLYSPEEFGVLAIFVSIVLLFVPVATFRYSLAIPLPRSEGVAINVLALSFAMILLTTISLAMLLPLTSVIKVNSTALDIVARYFWLLVVAFLFSSLYEVLSLWATRRRAYKLIASTIFTQNLFGSVVKIALGIFSAGSLGLVVGQVFSFAGGIVSFTTQFKKDIVSKLRFITFFRMKKVAYKYRSFPIFRLPSQFLLVLSTQAPILLFSQLYDVETTGQLSMAFSVTALPLAILGQSMSKAYFGEVATIGIKAAKELRLITIDVVKKLFAISIVPTLILYLFGEEAFSVLLGENWARAGQFSSAMSIYLISQFITVPVVSLFNIFENQIIFLILNAIRMIGVIIFIFILPYFFAFDANFSVVAYSIFMTIFYLAVFLYVLHFLKSRE